MDHLLHQKVSIIRDSRNQAGVGNMTAGVIAFVEPTTIRQGLFGHPHTFDVSVFLAMPFLLPAQQLGAGYLASACRVVSSSTIHRDPGKSLTFAAKLSFSTAIYNIVSLVLVVCLLVGMLGDTGGQTLIRTLMLSIFFLGVSAGIYYPAMNAAFRMERPQPE